MALLTQSLSAVARTKKLLSFISVIVLGSAVAQGGKFSADFDTDCGVCIGNTCGTLWDGLTLTNVGSLELQVFGGGAGTFGSTTNGPVSGSSCNGSLPCDGFFQFTFASPTCDGSRSSDVCGAWMLDDFDNVQPVAGFNFECDLRMGNGDPDPIGGLSVNFMRTNDPVLLALNVGDTVVQMNGQISPNGGRFSDFGDASQPSLIEQGTTTGLSVCFQMQDNGDYQIPPDAGAVGRVVPGISHDGVGLHVRMDDTVIAAVPMPNGTTEQTYDSHGNPLIASDPTGTNAANDPTGIETSPYTGSGCDTNLLWVHFKMNLSTNGIVNVWWKNVQVVTNLPTSFLPFPGRFLIAARAGSKPVNIDLDNLVITTIPFTVPTNPPTIHITRNGGQTIINYKGILQSSPSPTSGYVDVPDASSPYTIPQGTNSMFFRSGW